MLPLLLLVSLSWASSNDWKPRYLSGLSLSRGYENNVQINNYHVKYDFSYENVIYNSPYNKDEIDRLIYKSFDYSISKMSDLKLQQIDCKQDLNVHFVQLDGQTLNNDSRFGSWRRLNGANLTTIHGIYDPTISLYRDSIILFTLINPTSNNVVVHEMAHYWYDRFCLYEKNTINTEEFARAVEDDYILGILE